jgi:FlaA1/EpsC-like NDP-sugar epimerase
MKRFFMTIPEAVQLVLQAGGMGNPGDLFVLNMGEQLKVLDLAIDLIRLSGLDPAAIPIEFTGIRPGEKLEEALWESDATVEATSNPDILRVGEHDLQLAIDINSLVDDVMAAAESGDAERFQMTLALTVPGFIHGPASASVATSDESF